ncbi:MAG TPA: nucleotide exchange factor GrpE [Pyrinomonadaceae bacterium]|nr:nucleotide exchange factor GrpE [Pyrinomonadaceae bacterium]
MAPDRKGDSSSRIPINFFDSDEDGSRGDGSEDSGFEESSDGQDLINTMSSDNYATAADADPPEHEDGPPAPSPQADGTTEEIAPPEHEDGLPAPSPQADGTTEEIAPSAGGPEVAELVATRAELKRLESEVKELKDALARRQADFENYRKRMERERSETYSRVVVDIAAKLLPVLDNLKRALETEASLEASESDEFRHFLSGVDLIYKQLNGVLDALGVKPVLAEGEQFNPHLHEAVVTEPTDDYEPDTVMQEIVRGFRVGDKLIRPALVKVAVKK